MYRISIFGHKPEYIQDHEFTKRLVKRTLELLLFQYGEELIINIVGDIGVGLWAAEACRDIGIKLHMFLPCPPEELSIAWYDDQRRDISSLFRYAWANSIYSLEYSVESEIKTYCGSIDMSDFVVCFWGGKRQGITFDNIKYSLKKNKITLNGFNELKLITNEDL